MKKFIALILALAACLTLCGCSGEIDPLEDGILSYEELTMELPTGYVKLNTREYDGMFTFTYGKGNTLITGYRELASSILSQYPDMTEESYGQLVIDSNALDAQLETVNGLTCFTFRVEDTEEDTDYTYIGAVYACTESFWLMQIGCPSEEFPENESEYRKILESVILELPEITN